MDEKHLFDRLLNSGRLHAEEDIVQPDLSEQLVELIPRMRRFAAGLCGSTDRGDELVQAACERLLRNKDQLRTDTRLDSWLFQVIRNLHIDGIRAQNVRDRSSREMQQSAELHVVNSSPMESHMMLHEIEAAMRQLSDEHRTILMLICVEGLSYKESANLLQVPIGTVTSRLVRARKALIAKLGPRHSGHELEASR